jgi:NADPH:quinone reductase-like Zn-dependent oxidoreductase
MMKAIKLTKYGSPDDLELVEIETPSPNHGEVLVKNHATSINDWDWNMVRGTPFYIRLLCGFLKPKVRIPGVDVAGEVEAVGDGVTNFQPGDRVYGDLSDSGFGAFGEYVCAPEDALAKMPKSMTFPDAAALPHAAALALQGLRDVIAIQPNAKLLINGAGGGVGTQGVQIARSMGIKHITGVDHHSKFETMRMAGFDEVVDYTTEDFTRRSEKYDFILDTKTNRSPVAYLRALNPGGTYVTVGGIAARLIQSLLYGPILRRITQKNIKMLALKPNKGLVEIGELYQAGKLLPILDAPYKLENTSAAINHFGSGKHVGKVIVSVKEADPANTI